MERFGWMVCLVASLVVPAGCTGCSSSNKDESKATSKAAKNDASDEAPDQAVFAFLEAVRTGDDTKASEMLTSLAREKTEESGLEVAPSGSDTASFEVGEVELISADDSEEDQETAHVASTWTDIDEEGEPHPDEILWVLRHESEGWRIRGMATKVFPDQKPLFLDFEDPDDMERKQRLVEEETERRARKEANEFMTRQRNETSQADDDPGDAQPEVAEEESEEEPTREVRQTKPKAKPKRR
jgi:hypothetical protein